MRSVVASGVPLCGQKERTDPGWWVEQCHVPHAFVRKMWYVQKIVSNHGIIRMQTIEANYYSYTHLIQALGIVRKPTMRDFLKSKYSCTHDIDRAIYVVGTNMTPSTHGLFDFHFSPKIPGET